MSITFLRRSGPSALLGLSEPRAGGGCVGVGHVAAHGQQLVEFLVGVLVELVGGVGEIGPLERVVVELIVERIEVVCRVGPSAGSRLRSRPCMVRTTAPDQRSSSSSSSMSPSSSSSSS